MPKIRVLRMAWNDYDIIEPGDATTDELKFQYGCKLFGEIHRACRTSSVAENRYKDMIKRVNKYIHDYMTWDGGENSYSIPAKVEGYWEIDLNRDIPHV